MTITKRTSRILICGLALAVAALAFYALLHPQQSAFAATALQDTGTPATVDPGPGTAYLDPVLWGILQKQAAGDTGVPANVTLGIDVRLDIEMPQTLAEHVAAVGGRSTGVQEWEVPTSRALEIIHRADVFYVTMKHATAPAANARLDETLNAVTLAIANGIPAADAVQYGRYVDGSKLLVEVTAPDHATVASFRAWLKEQKIYSPSGDPVEGQDTRPVVLLMPGDQIAPMLAKFTTVKAMAPNAWGMARPMTRSRWAAEPLEYQKRVVQSFKPPAPQFYGPRPTPPKTAAALIAASKTEVLKRHNVNAWHDAGYKGDNVKVGIIDWGYADHAQVPAMPTLTKTTTGSLSSRFNTYCQSIYDSIVPNTWVFIRDRNDCQPTALFGINKMRHGLNITELVKRMAPDADMLFAQANSPRQVYNAATWLKNKGADVIVHAAGWQYDSAGDGEPQMGIALKRTSLGSNEHGEGRYFPSPLATVDEVTKNGGPVWVNAAGNHELWSMWHQNPTIINDEKSDYHGYVVFNPRALTKRGKTCQRVPTVLYEVALYSMRWADSWPVGAMNLHYELNHAVPRTNAHLLDHQKSTEGGSYTANYPVRRNSGISDIGTDLCLRIYVVDSKPKDGKAPAVPKWIQFQALVAKNQKENAPTWRYDLPGRSMVNPSESDNPALLAVGALSLHNRATAPMEGWVSRGPVFTAGDNIKTATPGRVKPDVVGSTDGGTYTQWRYNCYETFAPLPEFIRKCKKVYFTGTSGATAHTGGIAAVVAEWLNDVNTDYQPEDVANFIRETATPKSGSAHGLVTLPCFSVAKGTVPFSQAGSWSTGDCDTAGTRGAKSDFYSFHLSHTRKATITLTSGTKDALLKLRGGAHAQAAAIVTDNNSGGGTNAKIVRLLEPGYYTIEVTTNGRNSPAKGSYSLRVDTASPTARLTPIPGANGLKVSRSANSHRLYSAGQVELVANPTGEDRVLQISTRPISSRTTCTATQNLKALALNRASIYVRPCAAGDGVLELRDRSTKELLNIYRIEVKR